MAEGRTGQSQLYQYIFALPDEQGDTEKAKEAAQQYITEDIPCTLETLAMQEEVVPLIFKRLITSAHDVFIENAAIILANADMKYVEQLYDIFKEIQNSYARSETSLVFGVKKRTEYSPLLLEQYRLIKQECPNKDYEQGPLLALHLIHE